MKKYITLFAMLMIVSIAMADNARRIATNANETINVVLDSATQCRSDAYGTTTFYGYDADSTSIMFSVETTGDKRLAGGTYNDSIFDQLRFGGDNIDLVEGLSDIVIVVNEDIYNVKFTMRGEKYTSEGNDTAIYDIDVTFKLPKELQYHEAETDAAVRSSVYSTYQFRYQDSKYSYYMGIGMSHFVAGDTMWLCQPDTTNFNVYDVNDTAKYKSAVYQGFSGWYIATPVAGDTTFTIVGELLCMGNIKFYINCKKPTAVEDVVMPSYNVFTEGEAIIVNGADGKHAEIFDVTGRMVASSEITTDNARFTVSTGVYFVRVDGVTTKVVVK